MKKLTTEDFKEQVEWYEKRLKELDDEFHRQHMSNDEIKSLELSEQLNRIGRMMEITIEMEKCHECLNDLIDQFPQILLNELFKELGCED